MKQIFAIFILMILGQPLHAEVRIAVMGVGNDMNLIERWASFEGSAVRATKSAQSFRVDDLNAYILAPRPETSLAQVASLLYQASAAVIVIDTTQGPLPTNREHIILARQARVPVVAIMLANVDELHALAPGDAADLLMLEEEEVRSVMAAYELDGRSALAFHDSNVGANAPKASAGGLGKAASMVANISRDGDRNPPAEPQQQGRGQVYLLTEAEAKGVPASISGSTPMVIWSDGATATVELTPTRAAAPGDVADVSIRGEHGFLGKAGSRFVLIKDESVVGLGVFTEVSRFTSSR